MRIVVVEDEAATLSALWKGEAENLREIVPGLLILEVRQRR